MAKTINIGIFGIGRGRSFLEPISQIEGVRLHAICDGGSAAVESAKAAPEWAAIENDVKIFTDFDEFIDCGLDAVILCNYFHEHAKFAIKAIKKGIAVMSDTTAAPTLKECVELCEAVEENDGKYMLGANVPFYYGIKEITRVYKDGTFGKVKYAEAEYMHYDAPVEADKLSATNHHWRKYIPMTYYNMHTLGALMAITGDTPHKVNARAIYAPEMSNRPDSKVLDTAAFTMCVTNSGALFHTTGCAHLGPNGKWLRISCENGTLETFRENFNGVKLAYVPWKMPEGAEAVQKYGTTPKADDKNAPKSTHSGSDYCLVELLCNYINGKEEPFFNVYNSVALSAAGIMAWLSILEDGKTYTVPDFKNKSERDVWRNHDLTPFPDENGEGATLPCSSK